MWANEIAKEIVNNNPFKDEYVLNCGTSTTGISHIGNFREISIVYFVSQALKKLNKKSKIILSFDDFDRFKKVPIGVENYYKKYIGMPVCDIPSPFSNKNFAQYFEDLFLDELHRLDIKVDAVCQSTRYKKSVYNKYFPVIFDNASEISKIINKNKKEESKREIEFPFHIYCENCNKDFVVVKQIDYDKRLINYQCACGFNGVLEVGNSTRIKPIFKVEWPMRWMAEGVDFEASGKSHMTKNGAFDISSEIFRKVFGGKKILAEKYEFVEMLGSTNRMSKTQGAIYTITDFLKIYSPKMLLWMFLKAKPNQKIKLDFGDAVLQNYVEYEKFIQNNDRFSIEMKEILEIDKQSNEMVEPSFKNIISEIIAFNSFDNIISKYPTIDKNVLLQKYEYALNWIEINQKKAQLLNKKNETYISNLSEYQKQIIRHFCKLMEEGYLWKDVIKKIKETYSDDESFNIKNLYVDLYNLMLGVNEGPSISKIINEYDLKQVLLLLEV